MNETNKSIEIAALNIVIANSYAYEYAKPSITNDELEREANKEWYVDFCQIQRESNIYAVASIRFKLQLLGFDCVKTDLGNELKDASKEFMDLYTKENPIKYLEKSYNGKTFMSYSIDMQKPSLRTTYAIQEHERWNAYMICSGMVPSTIEQIKEKNKGKRFDLRRHGNITTFEGLIDYRNIVSKSLGKDIESTDVIKYDYQLMDDVVWLLNYGGYTIIKKM